MKAPSARLFRMAFGTWLPISGKWKGDAYGYHPHGVISRPMIYTDHHNISGQCDAKVMTDPAAKFKRRAAGREASIGNDTASPNPTPETGELVTVYSSGEWVGPDGPWRARLRADMARALRDGRAIRSKQRAEQEQIRKEREAARVSAFSAAERSFHVTAN